MPADKRPDAGFTLECCAPIPALRAGRAYDAAPPHIWLDKETRRTVFSPPVILL
jgi:hypothetical protein